MPRLEQNLQDLGTPAHSRSSGIYVDGSTACGGDFFFSEAQILEQNRGKWTELEAEASLPSLMQIVYPQTSYENNDQLDI